MLSVDSHAKEMNSLDLRYSPVENASDMSYGILVFLLKQGY